MTRFSDETLSAFLDGQVDEATRAEIERALEQDSAFAGRVERLMANDALLREAVDAALGPPPAGLLAAVANPAAANVIPLTARRSPAPPARWVPSAIAAAAALVVGVVAGRVAGPAQAPALVVAAKAGPSAGPELAAVLTSARSGEPRRLAGGVVEVSLSFRAADGRFCRQFDARLQGDSRTGIACRQAGLWRLEDWTAGRSAAGGSGYETAGGPDNPVISAELARLGVSVTLDRAGEGAAIAAGWSTPTPARRP